MGRRRADKIPPGLIGSSTGVNLAALGMGDDEAGFQVEVIDFARRHGWQVFSIPDSRRATCGGFLDCTFKHDQRPRPIIVAELKLVGEEPRPDQMAWVRAWERMGVPVYVWTPASWDQIREVLQ